MVCDFFFFSSYVHISIHVYSHAALQKKRFEYIVGIHDSALKKGVSSLFLSRDLRFNLHLVLLKPCDFCNHPSYSKVLKESG